MLRPFFSTTKLGLQKLESVPTCRPHWEASLSIKMAPKTKEMLTYWKEKEVKCKEKAWLRNVQPLEVWQTHQEYSHSGLQNRWEIQNFVGKRGHLAWTGFWLWRTKHALHILSLFISIFYSRAFKLRWIVAKHLFFHFSLLCRITLLWAFRTKMPKPKLQRPPSRCLSHRTLLSLSRFSSMMDRVHNLPWQRWTWAKVSKKYIIYITASLPWGRRYQSSMTMCCWTKAVQNRTPWKVRKISRVQSTWFMNDFPGCTGQFLFIVPIKWYIVAKDVWAMGIMSWKESSFSGLL